VNATNEFSHSPLFECVQINRWDIVELLLQRGADTTIKDKNGEDIF
jgi:ankyrin repeat protein